MNIKFMTGWVYGDAGIASTTHSNLALCGQGRAEGNASGLIPLKIADGVFVTPVTNITSSTSTTKRGSRSAVIKVEIPYTALTKDAEGNPTTDPTRSGGALSMHVVIAIPAAATKDLQGINGPASQQVAEAQVALVNYLLRTIIGKQFGSMPAYMPADDGSGGPQAQAMSNPKPGVEYSDVPASSEKAPVPTTSVGGYDGVGFDLTQVKVYKGLNSALSRIANNLPALSCADVTPETQELPWRINSFEI